MSEEKWIDDEVEFIEQLKTWSNERGFEVNQVTIHKVKRPGFFIYGIRDNGALFKKIVREFNPETEKWIDYEIGELDGYSHPEGPKMFDRLGVAKSYAKDKLTSKIAGIRQRKLELDAELYSAKAERLKTENMIEEEIPED